LGQGVAELNSGIDRRSTVQAHIFEHIDQFVVRDAVMRDGEVWVSAFWWGRGGRAPLEEASHVELFVHPLTGILLPNRRLREARAAHRARYGNWGAAKCGRVLVTTRKRHMPTLHAHCAS
jgi:hypothetical protein